MKGLLCIREEVHNLALNYRTIEHIINRIKFTRLFADSSEEEQEKVYAMIMKGDRHGVSKWMKNHPSIGLDGKGTMQLRDIGRRLKIPDYQSMSRDALIVEIMKKELGHG